MRGIFFEEAAARAVHDRLRRDGFDATVSKEPFAGEDDDEDHPWAVVTDAPAIVLELLVEEHDGWLDDSEPVPLTPAPLPTSPRRTHRPQPENRREPDL